MQSIRHEHSTTSMKLLGNQAQAKRWCLNETICNTQILLSQNRWVPTRCLFRFASHKMKIVIGLSINGIIFPPVFCTHPIRILSHPSLTPQKWPIYHPFFHDRHVRWCTAPAGVRLFLCSMLRCPREVLQKELIYIPTTNTDYCQWKIRWKTHLNPCVVWVPILLYQICMSKWRHDGLNKRIFGIYFGLQDKLQSKTWLD